MVNGRLSPVEDLDVGEGGEFALSDEDIGQFGGFGFRCLGEVFQEAGYGGHGGDFGVGDAVSGELAGTFEELDRMLAC